MHPISLLVWLLPSLYVQGEIPSLACPSLSGAFTSFLLVIQYLHGSPELSGLLRLPVKKPYALSPHICIFPIPGPWSYCFLKHFNICLIVGFFSQLLQKWEFSCSVKSVLWSTLYCQDTLFSLFSISGFKQLVHRSPPSLQHLIGFNILSCSLLYQVWLSI